MNNCKELKNITGKLLIFGGPYSNLEALQAMKKASEEHGIPPSNIICTGDIVGYCADPDASIQLVKDWGIHAIAGNVELNIKDDVDDCGCNFEDGSRCDVLSKQWFPFAKLNTGKDSRQFIEALPEFLRFVYAGQEVFVLHGSHENTSEFIFKSTSNTRKRIIFKETNSEVILGGHCGLPFSDHLEDRLWLNAGVIGMPANDGMKNTWYLILDDEGELSYTFHQLNYDYETANRKMIRSSLPASYAKTLLTGIWDNCDVLPDLESSQQGMVINI